MTITDTTEADLEAQVGAYAERLFETGLAALEAITISLGRELGLYEHLADDGGVTAGELSQRAGIDARYAQEWLEQQAAAGLIDVTAASGRRRPAPLRALRRRPGVPAPPREPRLGRPAVRPAPGDQPRLPGRARPRLPHRRRHPVRRLRAPRRAGRLQPARLRQPPRLGLADPDPRPRRPSPAHPAPRAAEIGCGEGWAAISLARAFPELRVDGFDNDEASIAAARKYAAEAGVSDRAKFEVIDVTRDLRRTGHARLLRPRHGLRDDPRPGPTRRSAHHDAPARQARRGAPGHGREGRRDLRSADRQPRRAAHVRRQRPALPARRTRPTRPPPRPAPSCGPPPSRPTPTSAGFSDVEVLPIEHDLFRFYHLIV